MKFFFISVMLIIALILAFFSVTSYLPQVAATYIGPTDTTTLYSEHSVLEVSFLFLLGAM